MLEPYDPEKIPVVMVHGLWSSPVTWMEMFNDLRSKQELRDHYQFWFYLYPTGQPFWLSAKNMRDDLVEVTRHLDPQRRSEALHQMVLVGHSMGGLVSRLQTLYSEEDFWHLVSDQSFRELQAEDETREELGSVLFFEPNPSVRRVITLGTPHRGSNFANSWTRWISHRLFRLPEMLTMSKKQVVRDNPDLFRDTELLSINTSIDSLSPESPFLPAMLKAQRAPWVTYHNVVGRSEDKSLLGRLGMKVAGEGDGVVSLASAQMEDVESELVVEADHVHVHQHPRSVLEVRRILLEHLDEIRTQQQQSWEVQQAGFFEEEKTARSNRHRWPRPTEKADLELLPPLPRSKQWPKPESETALPLQDYINAPRKFFPHD
jgi:pimeloyl-ACP methyl ester carboxylesterase